MIQVYTVTKSLYNIVVNKHNVCDLVSFCYLVGAKDSVFRLYGIIYMLFNCILIVSKKQMIFLSAVVGIS